MREEAENSGPVIVMAILCWVMFIFAPAFFESEYAWHSYAWVFPIFFPELATITWDPTRSTVDTWKLLACFQLAMVGLMGFLFLMPLVVISVSDNLWDRFIKPVL